MKKHVADLQVFVSIMVLDLVPHRLE